MNRNKRMIKNKGLTNAALGFLASGFLLCAAGSALGQAHTPAGPPHKPAGQAHVHAGQILGARPITLTPTEQAMENEKNSLDAAAATTLDLGQYTEAEADARQSMSVGPDSGIAQEVLAAALNAQGKTQEALEVYQQMASVGGDQARNLLPYALLLLKAGQWAPALAAYNKAQPFANGTLISANNHFARTVPQPKDLEAAIHIALGLTYGSEASWGGHSQDDKAMSEHKQALALEPNSALANYYYGYALQRMGRRAEAQAAFKKAATLGSNDVKATAEREIR